MIELQRFAPAFLEDDLVVDLEAPGAHLAHKELFRCTWRNVRMGEARLERCILEQCVFEDCDFTRAELSVALRGVRFVRCKLLGIDFSQLSVNPDVSFVECDMRYAAFVDVNLRKISFSGSSLRDATFTSCSLIDADFERADLAGAAFSRCTLEGADFSLASGVFFEPRENRAAGAVIPVETAILLAQAQGLCVAGEPSPRAEKPKKRR